MCELCVCWKRCHTIFSLGFQPMPIYELNAMWQLLQLSPQNPYIFKCGPMSFIHEGWSMQHHNITKFFGKFHMKALDMVTLPCFKNKLKQRSCCYGLNFDHLLDTIGVSCVVLHGKFGFMMMNLNPKSALTFYTPTNLTLPNLNPKILKSLKVVINLNLSTLIFP
jgi:hypothetical protein